MDTTKFTCPGCHKVYSHHGLSLHIAKTSRSLCLAAFAASQPQSLPGSFPHEQALLTLTANPAPWSHPDQSFGSEHPSGDDGTPSDLPAFSAFGITTGSMDDCKLAFHRPMPYAKPITAMDLGDASNSPDEQDDDRATEGMSDTTDDDRANEGMSDTTDNNQGYDNDSVDGDDMADTADATDANVLEIITRIQADVFLGSNSTAPHPSEQILSAESDPPPEILHNPVGPNPRIHPEEVTLVERFPHGNPGAPIDDFQGPSMCESQEMLGGSIWAPFQSQCDWDFARWAKMKGPTSSGLADLFAIPNVRLLFLLFTILLNVVKGCRETRPLIPYRKWSQ